MTSSRIISRVATKLTTTKVDIALRVDGYYKILAVYATDQN